MSSPIYLGSTQMCEHGLGWNAGNVNTGWSGTFGASTRVNLWSLSVTNKNPSGAYIYGMATFTCYTSVAGSLIQGSTNLDGGGQTVWGLFCFNNTSTHWQYAYSFYVGPFTGAHTVEIGLWVASGNAIFDSNDGGDVAIWEIP